MNNENVQNYEDEEFEVVVAAPQIVVVDHKMQPTIDCLEPIFRKTINGTPVKLIEYYPGCPKDHVMVKVLAYPKQEGQDKSFQINVRGDDLIPPFASTQEAPIKRYDQVFIRDTGPTAEEKAALKLAADAAEAADAASLDPAVIKARQERMANARKHRSVNNDYTGVPDDVKCSKCNQVKTVGKYVVVKRAKADGKDVDTWIKTFQCPVCNPKKRGRQPSAKYANLPKELNCHHEGCTFVQKQHPSITEKAARAANVGFNVYVATWKCRPHRK